MNSIYRNILSSLAALALAPTLLTAETLPTYPYESSEVKNERMEWWDEAKYGMFIHWGLYAIPARGEWVMIDEKKPVADYTGLASEFNPVKFDAKKWISVAKEAGMKYIVITAKHHDGFAMYDSKVSPYNIVNSTPYKKDPLKELSEECKKAGIKFGIYYSQAFDWFHPGGAIPRGGAWDDAQKGDFNDYFHKISMPQIEELIKGYDPSIIWFDMPFKTSDEHCAEMRDLVRSLSPNMVVNSRLKFSGPQTSKLKDKELNLLRELGVDYLTYRDREIPPNPVWRNWETCMTLNHSWGFTADDHEWKTPATIIEMLMRVANSDGNFLLNFGPTAEGELPEQAVSAVLGSGAWLKVNGEALYGTRGSTLKSVDQAPSYKAEKKGKKKAKKITPDPTVHWLATERLPVDGQPGKIYITVFDWPKGNLELKGISTSVSKAYPLANREINLDLKQNGDTVSITLPEAPLDKIATVICLEL